MKTSQENAILSKQLSAIGEIAGSLDLHCRQTKGTDLNSMGNLGIIKLLHCIYIELNDVNRNLEELKEK